MAVTLIWDADKNYSHNFELVLKVHLPLCHSPHAFILYRECGGNATCILRTQL
jgi:hypothetical protein